MILGWEPFHTAKRPGEEQSRCELLSRSRHIHLVSVSHSLLYHDMQTTPLSKSYYGTFYAYACLSS